MAPSADETKPVLTGQAADQLDSMIDQMVTKKAPAETSQEAPAQPTDTEESEVTTVDQDENGVYSVESLCMNCHDNGTTRLLLIKIPYFRNIILESFSCEHCGHRDNSVKSADSIQEKGAKYTLVLEKTDDFQRQIVRSDTAVFKIEDLEVEMPTGQSQFTNVEGMLSKALSELQSDQPLRKVHQPEVYEALEAKIIQPLTAMLEGEKFPFTISLDDPTGNSWIEPSMDDKGSKYKRIDYARTKEQNEALGIMADQAAAAAAAVEEEKDAMEGVDIVDGQVYTLPAECPGCAKPCVVNMQKVKIPHFKEVFIWATVCEHCGYRTNDVKTGGAVPEKGTRITLEVKNKFDLSRDILKSESCALISKELELEVHPGTLGGRFTTVEGLLTQVRDQLKGQIFDVDETPGSHGDADLDTQALAAGDSMTDSSKSRWTRFFAQLDAAINAEKEFSITLEDPLGNSYVQSLCDPDPDPQLFSEEYERTEEEEEDLGLKDMKVEDYEEDHAREMAEKAVKDAEEAAAAAAEEKTDA